MKTEEQFKEQASAKDIINWPIHNCSICKYQCGYYFEPDGSVYYDNGCDCGGSGGSYRTWKEVADHYNRQTNPEYINKMNEFWGFQP